jgi:hypothetical protein
MACYCLLKSTVLERWNDVFPGWNRPLRRAMACRPHRADADASKFRAQGGAGLNYFVASGTSTRRVRSRI